MESHRDESPFGDKRIRLGNKTGGANSPGKFGGLYSEDGQKCLIKQETKGDKIIAEKVISEALAGVLLAYIYNQINVKEDRYAKVNLIQIEENLRHDKASHSPYDLYIQSMFIPNYLDDFWKYAYRCHYQEKYEKELPLLQGVIAIEEMFSPIIKKLEMQLKNSNEETKKTTEGLLDTIAQNINDFGKYLKEFNKLNRDYRVLLEHHGEKDEIKKIKNKIYSLEGESGKTLQYLSKILADHTVNNMERPSGAVGFNVNEVRQVMNSALSPIDRKNEFIEIVVPRLLLADYGIHNGNIGVNSAGQIVSLDFGAAFYLLREYCDIYDSLNRGWTQWWKNHLLEYGSDIIAGPEMAEMLIKVSKINSIKFEQLIKSSTEAIFLKYDDKSILDFNERLGTNEIGKNEYQHSKNINSLHNNIILFLQQTLNKRCLSFRRQGCILLLANCINDRTKDNIKLVDIRKLNNVVKGPYSEDIKEMLENPLPQDKKMIKNTLNILDIMDSKIYAKVVEAAKKEYNIPLKKEGGLIESLGNSSISGMFDSVLFDKMNAMEIGMVSSSDSSRESSLRSSTKKK